MTGKLSVEERRLVVIAESHPSAATATKAMIELREVYDPTYLWCDDCDGLVVKERDCCMNRAVEYDDEHIF